ncbi:MAG TPA: DUF5301 domain-containing protein [Clostridia bacterium]|nr:DUF5301 domain-containing protein [Clostridia bacterium]
MKWKPIIVITVLVVVLIGAYAIIDHIFPKAATINTPDIGNVETISIVRNDGSSVDVATAEFGQVLQNIAKTQPIRKTSVNDRPVAKVYYAIEVAGSDREYHYFIYMEGNQAYIEIPYEGIYRTDNQLFDTVEGYFKG